MAQWRSESISIADDGIEIADGCLVLPAELEEAVTLFVMCATQWRWISNGWDAPRRTGLDFAAVRAMRQEAGIKRSAQLLADIRSLEVEALIALSE